MRDKPVLQGVSIGSVVTAISAAFMFLFHKHLPLEVVTFLPVAIAFVAHYFGINFSMTRAALKQLAKDEENPPPMAPIVN